MDISPIRIGYCLSLSGDWASPLAGKARKVIYWYFGEVTKLKADVGVSDVERQAAAKENA